MADVKMNLLFMLSLFIGLLVIFLSAYVATRLVIILNDIYRKRKIQKFNFKRRKQNVKAMIILGSGGHTAEMMRLIDNLGSSYTPRHYVIATTDKMSEEKVRHFEKQRSVGSENKPSKFIISRIPRSREVKQSWVTTVMSTAYASFHSLLLVAKSKPDLVLCNGPGTCIPICTSAFLLTVLGIKRIAIVFVESICRVETLSLSGKILYYFADHIIVQWPELKEKYPSARFLGRLV